VVLSWSLWPNGVNAGRAGDVALPDKNVFSLARSCTRGLKFFGRDDLVAAKDAPRAEAPAQERAANAGPFLSTSCPARRSPPAMG